MSEASEVIAEVSTTIAPEMAASAGQSDSVNRDISTNSSPLRDTSNSNSVLLDSIDSSFSSLDFGKKEPNISVGKIFWSCAINLFLPFVNGMMLGFGEIFAHELGFRWGWSAARVSPSHRMITPPGVDMVGENEKPGSRRLLLQS